MRSKAAYQVSGDVLVNLLKQLNTFSTATTARITTWLSIQSSIHSSRFSFLLQRSKRRVEMWQQPHTPASIKFLMIALISNSYECFGDNVQRQKCHYANFVVVFIRFFCSEVTLLFPFLHCTHQKCHYVCTTLKDCLCSTSFREIGGSIYIIWNSSVREFFNSHSNILYPFIQ